MESFTGVFVCVCQSYRIGDRTLDLDCTPGSRIGQESNMFRWSGKERVVAQGRKVYKRREDDTGLTQTQTCNAFQHKVVSAHRHDTKEERSIDLKITDG